MGFSPDDIERVREAIRSIAGAGTVVQAVPAPFGVRYIVDGTFAAPNGTTASLRTVWIIETAATDPRFVTAFPQRPKKGASD